VEKIWQADLQARTTDQNSTCPHSRRDLVGSSSDVAEEMGVTPICGDFRVINAAGEETAKARWHEGIREKNTPNLFLHGFLRDIARSRSLGSTQPEEIDEGPDAFAGSCFAVG
jgi:hypothetical protein